MTEIIRIPCGNGNAYIVAKGKEAILVDTGKRYASLALNILIEKAKREHKLHRLEAGTSPMNVGSQLVLIRNGFQFVGKYSQYYLQGSDWVDSLIFERILD